MKAAQVNSLTFSTMDSCSNKHNGSLMFKAPKPHFFKIILSDTIGDRKLSIPRRFAQDYGNDLSSPIILKVPSGAEWQVELVKCDDGIWLQNGWKEFMEYYSIVYGSFLVFEYNKKNCNFNVIIFDKSASEVDYPFSEHNKELNPEKDFQEPDIQETENAYPIEILSHSSQCQKTKEKSPLHFPWPHKEIKSEFSTGKISPQSFTEQVEWTDFEAKNGKGGMSSNEQRSNRIVSKEAKANAIQRASTNYECGDPFFMLTVQASYVGPSYKLATIPVSFAKRYLQKDHGNATLDVLYGRTWPVEYHIRINGNSTKAEISRGWRKFVQGNHLKVGNVCVFELMNRTKMAFRVAIFCNMKAAEVFRSSFGNNKNLPKTEFIQKPSSSIPSGVVAAAKRFTSTSPFFRTIIKSYHLEQSSLYVPSDFMVEYTKQGTENVMLEVEKRMWPVKIQSCPPYNHGKLCGGWNVFVMENSLQVGDVCILELMKGEIVFIKVSIFRHLDYILQLVQVM